MDALAECSCHERTSTMAVQKVIGGLSAILLSWALFAIR